VLHNVLHSESPGNFHGIVGASVINNHQFDMVDSWYGARNLFQDRRKGFLFVEAWNLYEETHVLPVPHPD
jgi:hypothetical protein